MKRAALAVLLLAALAAPGCGRRAHAPDTVVFWTSDADPTLAPRIAEFERQNPGLRVQLVPIELPPYSDSTSLAGLGTPAPDLCEFDASWLPAQMAGGRLCDWSAGVADLRDSLRGWPACMVGDAIYALPWRIDVTTLTWNPVLFARAGLDTTHAPRTWADVRAAALRIQKLGHGAHGIGIATGDSAEAFADFAPWAWSAGGGVLRDAADSTDAAGAGNRAALRFLVGLRRASICAARDTLEQEFVGGRLGMLLATGGGQHALGHALGWGRPGVALVPAVAADSGAGVSFARVTALASPDNARRKEGALRLARFLVGTPQQLAVQAEFREGLPSSVAAESLLAATAGAASRARVEQLARVRWPEPQPRWNAIRGALGAAVGDALLGRDDPDSALARATVRIAALARR